MATPSENIKILIAYWSDTTAFNYLNATDLLRKYDAARGAMRELATAASFKHAGARDAFASSSMFERCMLNDNTKIEQNLRLMHAQAGGPSIGAPPRQILLDEMHASAIGHWWMGRADRDPSTITTWLRSADVAAGAFKAAMVTDPHAGGVAAGLRLVRDAALPAFWLTYLRANQFFETITERLKEAPWTVGERTTINALAAEAEGRVARDMAPDLSALPSFVTGDGAVTPTVPPARLPWHKRGELWAALGIGLAAGGAVGLKPRR